MSPGPNGQRLERREEAAGFGVGAARVAASTDRGSDRDPARDGEPLPEGGRDFGSVSRRLGQAAAAKSGQRSAHRLWECGRGKTGQTSAHRLGER
jgi:hypothetical protein